MRPHARAPTPIFSKPSDPSRSITSTIDALARGFSQTLPNVLALLSTLAVLSPAVVPLSTLAQTAVRMPKASPTVPTTPAQPPPEVTPSVLGSSGASEGATTDSATDTDTPLSRFMVGLVLFLLIYISVGAVIMTIDNFVKRRNEAKSKEWVKARLEGGVFPSNRFLDEIGDDPFPSDFPIKSSKGGNRETRRVAKKAAKEERKDSGKGRTKGRTKGESKKDETS